MKEYLLQLVSETQDTLRGRHIAREYLQSRILQSLQRTGAMVPLAFHGGTALRFLYQIPRFSEDLDFALEQAQEQYNFRAYLKAIRADLTAENYPIEIRINDQKIVHNAFIRFRGLLSELSLSPHSDEVLAIKLEVDTNPPAGATLATSLVRRYTLLNLQHHDKASLFAGKLHAILQRPYTKGRDLYDLVWYLSDPNWPSPNLAQLNNALTQTGWQHTRLTEHNWQAVVQQQLEQMDWEKAVAEVRPFLIEPNEVELLTFENLTQLLSATG